MQGHAFKPVRGRAHLKVRPYGTPSRGERTIVDTGVTPSYYRRSGIKEETWHALN
jgi:hypothetical protein